MLGICFIPSYIRFGGFQFGFLPQDKEDPGFLLLSPQFLATGKVLSECKNEGARAAGSGGAWAATGGRLVLG